MNSIVTFVRFQFFIGDNTDAAERFSIDSQLHPDSPFPQLIFSPSFSFFLFLCSIPTPRQLPLKIYILFVITRQRFVISGLLYGREMCLKKRHTSLKIKEVPDRESLSSLFRCLKTFYAPSNCSNLTANYCFICFLLSLIIPI